MPSTAELLVKTSRTFALAIPLLPEPTQTTVCLAYLLFRIADTLEDAEAWPRDRRMRALDELCDLLGHPSFEGAGVLSQRWLRGRPTQHDAYLELLGAVPAVLAEVRTLPEGARQIVLTHALRTARGMRGILAAGDEQGRAQISNLNDLQAYCYVVAGIVGELLTELFLHDAPTLQRVASTLHEHQRAFGEGLQLVNILKDEEVDAREGRRYLPASLDRGEVLTLARANLVRARAYVDALWTDSSARGFFAFTALAQQLAEAALARIEAEGSGAKVSRPEVFEILERVQRASVMAPPGAQG